jgi:glycosyltransferase involved in cell wall biosynthesis
MQGVLCCRHLTKEMPIVILEALSYGVPVLASNIEANKEVGLDEKCYFKPGNIQILADKMVDITNKEIKKNDQKALITHAKKYSWDLIAKKTYDVYLSCLK